MDLCGRIRVYDGCIGADVMLRNESGMTALHFAARGGHIHAATELLSCKAEVHAGKAQLHEKGT